jgi:hypothetical protein
MYSALLLLAGIGMICVGAGAIALWRFWKRTPLKYFLYGGILWAIAIGIKLIMDFTITTPMAVTVQNSVPYLTYILFLSAYVGLRTGLLESGITYLAARKAGWSGLSLDDAIGVGIGFGATEAILLGIITIPTILSMISFSDFSLTQDLGLSIIMPIWERLFTMLCHISATALAILAVRPGKAWMLAVSILLKTVLDGALPLASYFGQPYGGMQTAIVIEIYVAAIGIISIAALLWAMKRMEATPASAPEA